MHRRLLRKASWGTGMTWRRALVLWVCWLGFLGCLSSGDAVAQSNQPDLFIGSFLVNPTVGPPGGPVDLSFELRNGGNADAGPFNASIYFSLSATLDVNNATLLKSLVIGGLQTGRTNVQRVTVNIPKNAPINKVGYIAVWVDSGKTVQESNESNNITSATFNVKPGPDLTVDNLSVSRTTPIPGEYITFQYRLRNIGRADVTPFYVYVYFSSDPLIDSQDTLLTSYRVQTLRANTDSNASIGIRIPTTASTNTDYYIGVVMDAREECIEEDEANNINTLKIHVVPPAPQKLPDFLITSMTLVDQSKPLGEQAGLNLTVKNQGTAAGYFHAYVYYGLSPRFLTQTSHRIVYRHTLNPGESKSFTNLQFPVPWQYPYNQTPKDYYVQVRLSGVTEFTTANNDSQVLTFRATKGKSRIEMSSITYSPLPCNYGLDSNNKIITPNAASGAISVRNAGYEYSTPFRAGIYASSDTTITTSDVLLGTIEIPSIAPQTTYSKNYTIQLNATIAPGQYYLGVFGDINGQIQNDYGNGRKYFVFHSRTVLFSKTLPDLVVESFTVSPPTQTAAGTTITIEAYVKNLSGQSYNTSCSYYYTTVQFGFWEDSGLLRYLYGTTNNIYNISGTALKVTASFSIPTTIQTVSGYVGVKVDANNYHVESNESNNAKSAPYKLVSREYDFSITSAKVSDSTLVWEKSTKVEINIANKGGLTSNFNVAICAWFSYDKILEPQDPRIGTAYANNYRAPTFTGSFEFTTQRWLPGNGYILLEVNCGSYQESNRADNMYAIPVTLRKFNVDFVTTKIYATPNYIRPSDTTKIFVEVKNQGLDKHIKQMAVCIYFSDDNVFDTKDRRYMCRPTSDILAGTGVAELSFTGDRSLIAGKRHIIAVLDTGIHGPYCGTGCWYSMPTYDETNENNNLAYLPIEVRNDVDLTAGSLSVSKTLAKIGENLTFRFQVKNVGSVSTNIPFDIWVVFSDNPTIDKSDRLVKKIRLQTLDAGKTSPDFNVSYAISSSVQPGERYFGLLIDADDEVKEPDETNNAGSVKINVLIPGIDLQVRSGSLDNDTVPAGQPVQVKIYSELQNFGTQSSPAFEVGYYLSTDNKFDVTDTLLASRQYAQPLPSTARTGQFVNQVSLTLSASANYYILIVGDPRNQVQEALETNNVLALPLKVVNRPPRITSLAVTTATEKQNYVYEAKAFDPDSDPLTWSLVKGPLGMAVDAKTGKVTWLPQPFQGGQSFDVTLEVSDGRGGVVSQQYKVTVQSVNDPPKIVSTAPTRALAGRLFVYTARAIDPDPGDAVTWGKDSGPASLTVDPNTGQVQWAIPSSEAGKTITIAIKAYDKARASDTQTFQLFIAPLNQPPKITTTAPTKVFSGSKYSYAAKATDPDTGDTLTWSRISGPTGLTVNSTSGLVEWSIPNGLEGQKITVTIRVSDQIGAYDDQTFVLDVQKQNRPPQITSTPPKIALLAQDMVYKPVAADPDAGDLLTWSLAQSPTGTTFDKATGEIKWRPTRSQVGQSFTFEITVTDTLGAKDTQKFSVVVKMRCEVDSDCPTGDICNNLLCEPPGCFKDGCQSPKPICVTAATCGSDLCDGVTCSGDEFCREGKCISSCGNVTCPSGQLCEDGQCIVQPCASATCAQGQRCDKDKCVRDPCFSGTCRYTRTCIDGRCIADPCLGIKCPAGTQCDNGQCRKPASCRLDIDCDGNLICAGGKCAEPGCLLTSQACQQNLLCLQQKCQSDPCAGKNCASGEFCREGQCVAACAGVTCSSQQTCEDGKCVPNPCAGVSCQAGEVCIAGQCEQNRCIAGRSCKHGRLCHENSCMDDPCRFITCPVATQRCVLGQCQDPPACVLDYECAGTQICVQGRCLPPACDLFTTCKTDELCVDGKCASNPCAQKQCPDGQVCRGGNCQASCAGVFCKPDERCADGKCVSNPCAGVSCKQDELCYAGKCVVNRCKLNANPCKHGRICTPAACQDNPCLQASCPAGQLCDPSTGQCSANIPCKIDKTCPTGGICEGGFCAPSGCYLQTCADGAVCRRGQCLPDPCGNVTCATGQYCKDGLCRWTCNCPKGQRCGKNGCELDPCDQVTCKDAEVCVNGVCEEKCPEQACRYSRVCLPGPGCADDPCAGVKCPDGTTCRQGYCLDKCMEQSCPEGTRCERGQCIAAPKEEPTPAEEPGQEPLVVDASVVETTADTQAHKEMPAQDLAPVEPDDVALPGCQCQAGSPLGPLMWLWLVAGLGLLLLRRRRL